MRRDHPLDDDYTDVTDTELERRLGLLRASLRLDPDYAGRIRLRITLITEELRRRRELF
jgi:hypothetical protein